MSAYTVWYREGTITVAKNSKTVTGTSTYWLSAGINPGDMFTTDGSNFYEVDAVTDSTHITLKTNYTGTALTAGKYAIIRNFTSGMSARIAALAAQLLGYFDKYIDTDMQSIHGKSAYEVAVQNGYTGTQKEWLESLKAAGEWASVRESLKELDTDVSNLKTGQSTNASNIATNAANIAKHTDILGYNNAGFHNSIFRGKNLGTTITDTQWAAIRSGAYTDMFIGDYWTINGHQYVIAHFDLGPRWYSILTVKNVILFALSENAINGVSSAMKFDKADYSGGFVSSHSYSENGYYQLKKQQIIDDIGESHIVTPADNKTGESLFSLSSSVDAETGRCAYTGVSGPQIGVLNVFNCFGDWHRSMQEFGNPGHMDYTSISRGTHLAYFRHQRPWQEYFTAYMDSYWITSAGSIVSGSYCGGFIRWHKASEISGRLRLLVAIKG